MEIALAVCPGHDFLSCFPAGCGNQQGDVQILSTFRPDLAHNSSLEARHHLYPYCVTGTCCLSPMGLAP